jgi:serine/threonine protein kinase
MWILNIDFIIIISLNHQVTLLFETIIFSTVLTLIFNFQVLRVFENYSFPADIWSLGALIAFFCNAKHLFTSVEEVFGWTKKNPLPGHYSQDLKDLVARLLDPASSGRPMAAEIWSETKKNNRQKLEI